MKHRQIYRYLTARISSGEFSPGSRLPTELELGRKFKVSRPTVARAMRDLQMEGRIERRAGDGTYVLSPERSHSERCVGLLIPELGYGEIFDPICARLAQSASSAGMSILWGALEQKADPPGHGRMDVSAEQAQAAAESLITQGAEGVFFAPLAASPSDQEVNLSIVARFEAAQIQVVLFDRDVSVFPKRSHLDLVSVDHFLGQFLATQHLLDTGHSRLAYLRWPGLSDSIAKRVASVHAAVARFGKSKHSARVVAGDPRDDACIRQLLARPLPDAVMCENDLIATILVQKLRSTGIKIPDDLSVLGFNGMMMAQYAATPLTTITQPFDELGDIAVATMRQRLESPGMPARTILLQPTLTIRESSPPRSTSNV